MIIVIMWLPVVQEEGRRPQQVWSSGGNPCNGCSCTKGSGGCKFWILCICTFIACFFYIFFCVNQNCKDCTCLVGSGGWRCCIIWISTCNLYFAFLLSFLTYIWCVRNEHISSFLQLRVTNSNPNLMSLVVAKFYWPY